jgi:hypothetical protein
MPVPLTFFRRADPYLAATVGYLRGAILSVLAATLLRLAPPMMRLPLPICYRSIGSWRRP